MSILLMQKPPNINPTRAGNQIGRVLPSDNSRAGARRDQKLAAIITPAANPSIPSKTFRFGSLKNKTKAAPAAVRNQVNSPAIRAYCIGPKLSTNDNKLIVYTPENELVENIS
ncbi:MAG: hypothetical protein QF831_02370 [Candidatus Thalassarchaeaceae archaeon]|jgi:hypothetical protein|nr:hypothetical protein [Candidatus Thalassarchaeaceae archaeon]